MVKTAAWPPNATTWQRHLCVIIESFSFALPGIPLPHTCIVSIWVAVQVRLMSEFLRSPKFKGMDTVPDPYFGGRKGFELVLDLLEDACEGLLTEIAGAPVA